MTSSSTETSPAFWSLGNGRGEIADGQVFHHSGEEGWVEVETLYSAISRGTEALVFNGDVPESEHQRMRAPFQQGEFPGPVRFGYMNVGRVIGGRVDLVGRPVFCLFPHQQRYRVPASAVTPLPEGVPPERAVLAANMETAINGLWDGAPLVGDRIAVVGCGVVGCLVAWLAARIPGARVTAIDPNPHRQAVLESLGVRWAGSPEQDDHDLVFHTSGHPGGLESALALAGNEARIIEMSWYGRQAVPASLGGSFHSRRLTLRSSQVGQVSPQQAPRWSHADRMALALSLLAEPALDALITGESPFSELPAVMQQLAAGASDTLCHRIHYA
ncbi:zinc-dependent alcohol dehydrogenase [Marinobacter zhanjiangensis]|uniref:Dehydrogenase n=1 Tax=Marinobacter zhanjiangensis TaxID=578215 RepID=A0ABQ3BAT6_9GAMM|nr:zinc-binding alcohol dehydrogenase [Marinobacter zhanjiangensis]GGY85450.1 dehydrogenase [Marinobacter zhanjiangensis]